MPTKPTGRPRRPLYASIPGRAIPFAGLLRIQREAADLSVEMAAERLGVLPGAWYRWEQGSREPRKLDTLRRIASVLGCRVAELLPE